jgi:CubicO group peptidase (beta-lactamase class C family)
MNSAATAILGLGLFAAACSDSGTGPNPRNVAVAFVSGDRQVGQQNTELPQPLVVEVVDRGGVVVTGARITFTTGPGSGRILGADSLTDAQGCATFRWELGDTLENTARVSLPDHRNAMAVATARARYRYVAPEAVADGWETADLSSVALDGEPFIEMMDSIRSGHYAEVHSVVVVRDGRLVFEEYFPGHDFGYSSPDFRGAYVEFGRDTRHNTHSATKSLISALVGLSIDEGFIPGEDEGVFDYYPDYADYAVGGKEAITIRDLLTMRSGLEWPEWNIPVGGGLSPIEQFNASSDPIGFVLSRPLVETPGTVFNYNGGTVNILCQLVARAAGTSVETFAHQHLFGPLGVTNYTFPRHRTGLTLCHGDIYIPPRGMAKFGQLFLNRGVWGETRVLSEEWIQKSVAPSVSVRNFNLYWASDYGYLWWLNDYTVGGHTFSTLKALGWGGQEIWVVPDEEMVVVLTGANYTVNPPTDELMIRFVFRALGGEVG